MLIPHPSEIEQMVLANSAVRRLATACVLGAAIGVERELSRKAAGIRTNVFVCMACAFFTLLSIAIAGDAGQKGQIAANIVQGIGFLGAGLILRNRSRIVGLTSAATIFTVASIGMACGAGLYLPAAFATVIVIVAMLLLGFAEHRLNLKTYPLFYELRGASDTGVMEGALAVLDRHHRRLNVVESGKLGGMFRLILTTAGTFRAHASLLQGFQLTSGVDRVIAYQEDDDE